MRLQRLLLTAILSLATSAVQADKVDDYVDAQMRWQHITGLSLAVVKKGVVIKAKGFGLANLETATPAAPESVYKIGSLSKQFIAAGIMLLVQDGKIGLEDPIGTYLEASPEAWKAVTVRHLLTHTSGLVREVPDFDPYRPRTDADVLKSVASLPLRFPPGDRWEYSNVGYYVLAEVIRIVSGRPWSDFIAERVFARTGMSASRTTTAEIVPHRATGYSNVGRSPRNAPDWSVVRPSGAFITTVLDLAKWDAALSSDRILAPASRELMWKPVTLNGGTVHPYGFGWFVDAVNGRPRVRHDGGLPGFSAEFERFESDRLTVIVLSNQGDRDLRDLALGVAGFFSPRLLPAPDKLLPDPEPQVTAGIRDIVISFTRGTLDKGLFTEPLGSALVAEMNAGFGGDLRRLGPLESLRLLERTAEGGERAYRYRLAYRHVPLLLGCTFDKEGRISKFVISD
jgi:CubicO group peptidase (beta-lactamase class C family)